MNNIDIHHNYHNFQFYLNKDLKYVFYLHGLFYLNSFDKMDI